MFPWACVIGSSHDRVSLKQLRIAQRNCFVGFPGSADQVVRIEKDRIVIAEHVQRDRVHVMHVDCSKDFLFINAQIAALVPDDDGPANFFPSFALIEYLVQVTGVAEQFVAYFAVQFQVFIPPHKVRDFDKFSKSSHRSLRFLPRHPHHARCRWQRL